MTTIYGLKKMEKCLGREMMDGKIVADITGLQGKELGMFMKSLALDAERVLEMGEEGVLSLIKEKMRISV